MTPALQPPPPAGAFARPAGWLLALTGLVGGLAGAAPETGEPFLKLRDATVAYHGSSEDFTGLAEIRIGWFGPADAADPLGGDLWWAADLAVREANEPRAGSVPATFAALPVRLVPRWSADPWGSGVSQLTRMVYDEQPLALLGSVDSASTHLAEQVVAKANLALVSPIATDKTVTLAGVSWMFSCAPDDTAIARILVDEIVAASHQSRPSVEKDSQLSTLNSQPSTPLVLLATTDHGSRMTAREVMRELARRGAQPAFRFDLPAGAKETDAALRAAAGAQPAAVIVIAGAEDAARLTRALRETLGPLPIFGGPSMGRSRFLELAGPAAEGVRFPLLFAPGPADDVANRFAEHFRTARGYAPDYAAALAYDATRLLIAAIRQAGPNRARIREALVQLSPWAGIAGAIRFDGTGQNRRTDLPVGTIRRGIVVAVSAPVGAAAGLASTR